MQLRNARQSVNTKTLAELEAEILEIQRKAGSGQHLDELTWRRKDRMCARVKELKKQQVAAEGHQQAVAGIIEPAGTMIPKEAPQALEFHPLADLFRLMMGNEFGDLVADIKANGLREKITLYKGKILDGRNRYRACREADVKVETDDFEGNETCARAFVISKNIHRRHLDAKQKREIVAALLKANPERSNNATAKMAKVDDKTVGAVRAELERRSEIPNVSTRTDSKGRKQPARKTTTRPPPVSEEVLQQRAAAAKRIHAPMGGTRVRDDTDPASNGEIARKNARIEELQADKLHGEVEETKAVRKPEGEGEGENSELGNLLRVWDRASQGAREKFKARVGLVAVQLPAKAMDDGLDIPECLQRAAP